jgi:hypothetical protein
LNHAAIALELRDRLADLIDDRPFRELRSRLAKRFEELRFRDPSRPPRAPRRLCDRLKTRLRGFLGGKFEKIAVLRSAIGPSPLIDGKMAGAGRIHSATGVLEEWRFAWVSGVLRGAAAGRGSGHFPVGVAAKGR